MVLEALHPVEHVDLLTQRPIVYDEFLRFDAHEQLMVDHGEKKCWANTSALTINTHERCDLQPASTNILVGLFKSSSGTASSGTGLASNPHHLCLEGEQRVVAWSVVIRAQ